MHKYAGIVFDIPLDRVFTYKNPEGMAVKPGCRVEAVLGKRKLTGWAVESSDETELDPGVIKEHLGAVDEEPIFSAGSLELARWLAGMYFCSLGEALGTMMPSAKKEGKSPASFDEVLMEPKALHLSAEQKAARDRICSKESGSWYLYGPTGSGKTEVFLQTAEATLAEGRGVIYLVPEIALSHQLLETVRERFGDRCAILHSGLSPRAKLAEWRRIQRREATVVVGARSAIFAPLPSLGLIVVDEEHESSYKAGNTPRYHARQVAMHRARQEGARLLLGSATPSIEVWQHMESGALEKLVLGKRLAGGDIPKIKIVDMREESGAISGELATAVKEVKARGGQTILFLNRRGFSWFWSCHSCGAEAKCHQCSVGLTYHKARDRLVCHYCGYSAPPPKACPQCGSLDTGWAGFGTERIEEDAARLFPNMSIARLDSDTVVKKGVLEKTLSDFEKGNIDILLGTQMVAKGLNFPKVQLVGVILADTSLNLPDFRASERAFALITQVAGRAGRFQRGGRVIVQTYRPRSPVIEMAASHDFDGFYRMETGMRRELGFPPFSRIIRLVFRSKAPDAARMASMEMAALLRGGDGVEILGPAECPVSSIAGQKRWQIIIRSAGAAAGRSLLKNALGSWENRRAVYLEIDPDPVSLL